MTPEDLARRLGRSRRAIIENRAIPRRKLGKQVLYDRVEVEEWLTTRRMELLHDTACMLANHFQGRPITYSGIAKLFGVWYRDVKAAEPPLEFDALVEWLIRAD